VPGKTVDDYYQGQQIVETREDTVVKYQTIWSPRYIDAPILRDTYSSGDLVLAERIFYLGDANYNVTGLMKKVDTVWQVVERYTYTPYGIVTYREADWDAYTGTNPQSLFSNRTLYTGRYLDIAIALMYYRARFYDTLLERFISTDPIAADINLYRYCQNDPVSNADPLGLRYSDHRHEYFIDGYRIVTTVSRGDPMDNVITWPFGPPVGSWGQPASGGSADGSVSTTDTSTTATVKITGCTCNTIVGGPSGRPSGAVTTTVILRPGTYRITWLWQVCIKTDNPQSAGNAVVRGPDCKPVCDGHVPQPQPGKPVCVAQAEIIEIVADHWRKYRIGSITPTMSQGRGCTTYTGTLSVLSIRKIK
jgi:RHS repeat-associated protein